MGPCTCAFTERMPSVWRVARGAARGGLLRLVCPFLAVGAPRLGITLGLVQNSKLESTQTLVTVYFCHVESRKTSACHPRLVLRHLQPAVPAPARDQRGGLPGPQQLTAESVAQGHGTGERAHLPGPFPVSWSGGIGLPSTWPRSRRQGSPSACRGPLQTRAASAWSPLTP